MIAYRIAREKYASKLVSSGLARRWNTENQYVVYSSSSISLATLELVVHRASIATTLVYKVMLIHINDSQELYKSVHLNDIPVDWRFENAYPALQKIGSRWYENNQSLVLKVPSAVIPQESNFVINTSHPGFRNNVKLIGLENYFWDERLTVRNIIQ